MGVTILDFADMIDRQIIITYYPNQSKRFSAKFVGAEVVDGSLLCGTYGNGKSPEQAINDYASQIAGKTIVFNARSINKAEYKVPIKISGKS